MQYDLLRILASHKRITIVGDEDQVHIRNLFLLFTYMNFKLDLTNLMQSIFSFNGADVSGFKSFRRDFLPHKEV